MSNIPLELKYVESHEWVSVDGEGVATIGITDHAQDLLGDVVFVELPEVGVIFAGGDEAGVVESVKAASDLYSPVSGEIVEINEALADAPETLNTDPYGDGWLFKVKLADEGEITELLDSEAYQAHCESED